MVPVLRKYADTKVLVDSKWNITTGNKKHIYELARIIYFTVVEKRGDGIQDFIHTPKFILIDTTKLDVFMMQNMKWIC